MNVQTLFENELRRRVVVVREFQQAAYPISTEIFEITDAGIQASGAFPTED